jgi:hypothetical protein
MLKSISPLPARYAIHHMNSIPQWLLSSKPTDWLSPAIALVAVIFSILGYRRSQQADQRSRVTEQGEARRQFSEKLIEAQYLLTQNLMMWQAYEQLERSKQTFFAKLPPAVVNDPRLKDLISDLRKQVDYGTDAEYKETTATLDTLWNVQVPTPELYATANKLIANYKSQLLRGEQQLATLKNSFEEMKAALERYSAK